VNDRRADVLAFTPLSLASGQAVPWQQFQQSAPVPFGAMFRKTRDAARPR
jgi:hypothetical protein